MHSMLVKYQGEKTKYLDPSSVYVAISFSSLSEWFVIFVPDRTDNPAPAQLRCKWSDGFKKVEDLGEHKPWHLPQIVEVPHTANRMEPGTQLIAYPASTPDRAFYTYYDGMFIFALWEGCAHLAGEDWTAKQVAVDLSEAMQIPAATPRRVFPAPRVMRGGDECITEGCGPDPDEIEEEPEVLATMTTGLITCPICRAAMEQVVLRHYDRERFSVFPQAHDNRMIAGVLGGTSVQESVDHFFDEFIPELAQEVCVGHSITLTVIDLEGWWLVQTVRNPKDPKPGQIKVNA